MLDCFHDYLANLRCPGRGFDCEDKNVIEIVGPAGVSFQLLSDGCSPLRPRSEESRESLSTDDPMPFVYYASRYYGRFDFFLLTCNTALSNS
jgi:hypothetical protein